MSWHSPNFITLHDLGIAYRKAKADLFYERGHPNAFELVKFEEHLQENLQRLFQQLQSNSLVWMQENQFVGTWRAIPKSIDTQNEFDKGIWHPSDPD